MSRKSRTIEGLPASPLDKFEQAIEPPIPFLNPDYAIPSPLYHYTTANAYVNILKCKYLRATNFSYLNDPSEVQYGTRLVSESIESRQRGSAGIVASFLQRLANKFALIAASEVYVCAFSGLRDDLSQWRAYGRSAPERFAIGFDADALYETTRAQPAARFERVYYKEPEQKSEIDHVLHQAIDVISQPQQAPHLEDFADAAARRLSRLLPTMKHPAYERENEWRVVLWEDRVASTIDFDTAGGVMRPFLRLRLPLPLPINEVLVLAPSRPVPALKAARIALAQADLSDIEPQLSNVPYAD